MSSQAEAELAIERLLDKMEAWLLQQPEAVLIWTQPRDTRKRAARAIADLLALIPTRENVEGNRKLRRLIIKELEHENREWYKDISL